MIKLAKSVSILTLAFLLLWPLTVKGQNSNATITGIVTDQSGAVVPGAQVTLTYVVAGTAIKVTTGSDGSYSFPNLPAGDYQLECSARGFSTFVQKGITLHLNQTVRIPIQLSVGSSTQRVEVLANASPLNFQNAVVKEGIAKQQIEQLPIEVEGGQRSAADFVKIMPGVATAGQPLTGNNNESLSFDGNESMSDEAVLDGVSMMEGLLSQSGMIAINADFPISPEAVGEISVLTSNYDPQYGATTGAVVVASTKSGTDQFHGGAYEYNRNTSFNARPFGVAERPKDIENDGGGYIGGPLKAPLFWSGRKKSYFFVNFEAYRSVGATTKPILTVPTAAMRSGDFSEWPYPIYDPNTTQPNPNFNPSQPTGASNEPYLRQQFPGNVIPPSAMAGSLAPDAPGPMGPTRERLAKPVIVAVEGYAVAGGLELALWCDLRVAARNAVFGVFSRRFGVPLIDGGTVRLPRLIGQGRALDMILTGRPVDAEEAFRIGLVDRLAEPGRALADSIALAEQIAAFPQASLKKDRASVLRQWSLDLPAALREEAKGAEAILTREGFAGAARFAAGAGRHGSFEDFEKDAKKEDEATHAGPLL